MYTVKFTKQALKDQQKIARSAYAQNARTLLELIRQNPWQNPPPYERLVGNLSGKISRRINIQHRLIYEVFEDERMIVVYSLWTHYEN